MVALTTTCPLSIVSVGRDIDNSKGMPPTLENGFRAIPITDFGANVANNLNINGFDESRDVPVVLYREYGFIAYGVLKIPNGKISTMRDDKLSLHDMNLSLDSSQRLFGGLYAPPADYDQRQSENCSRCSRASHQLVVEVFACSCNLCLGGIGVALWALEDANKNRRVLGAPLGGLGISAFTADWLLWWSGLILGLPPCYPSGNAHDGEQNKSPHGIDFRTPPSAAANKRRNNSFNKETGGWTESA
jgi:hypothetical protein